MQSYIDCLTKHVEIFLLCLQEKKKRKRKEKERDVMQLESTEKGVSRKPRSPKSKDKQVRIICPSLFNFNVFFFLVFWIYAQF